MTKLIFFIQSIATRDYIKIKILEISRKLTIGKNVKNRFEWNLSILAIIAESRYLGGYSSSYTHFITQVIFFIEIHGILNCIQTLILKIS